MTGAYYNEFDPYAAQWLRNLITAGLIAPGEVDERSILDVKPDDLRGFTQCHFFAGVGVWSYALRRAGWPDDRPVWSGSCPCQPFSVAGAARGFDDERHLWPAFHFLIEERGPAVVFGEQVASKDADTWIDLVQDDMEALGYAFGAVPFPSAGVGAPHIRDRLYWLADSNQKQRGWRADSERLQPHGTAVEWDQGDRIIKSNSTTDRLDNSDDAGLEGFRRGHQAEGGRFGEIRPVAPASESCRVEYATGDGRKQRGTESGRGRIAAGRTLSGLADSLDGAGRTLSGLADSLDGAGHGSQPRGIIREFPQGVGALQTERRPTGPVNGRWSDADWLFCRDGKWRPVEPGTFPLANGAPARVGRLRAYGNVIVAQAATEFVSAYLEISSC